MSDIIQLQKDIVSSIYTIPCTLEELVKRDFLKNRSEIGIDRVLMVMENKNWIYFRSGKYHAYKKFALSKEMSEYELTDKPTYKRPTAEQVKKYWNKK